MNKTRDSKKKLRAIGLVFLVIFLLSAALLFISIWERNQGHFPEHDEDGSVAVNYNGTDYVFKNSIETVLVIGLDTFDEAVDGDAYTNNKQADFVTLLVIDNEASTCSAIQINRDTITETNILGLAGEKVATKTQQIALAHTYGNGDKVSCRNTADAVSGLLAGVKVNHYLSLTMDAVSLVNDSLGGVEVEVLDDFTGVDDTLVKGETVTLMGEHALNYVRSRYGMDDSTNLNRMERQRQYLNALLNKAIEVAEEDETVIADTAVKISDYMVSDCSVTYLQDIFNKVTAYEFKGIYTLDGKAIVGEKYMEFYPEVDSVAKTVAELLCVPKE